MAISLDMKISTYWRKENGERGFTTQDLEKIKMTYPQIDMNEILKGE